MCVILSQVKPHYLVFSDAMLYCTVSYSTTLTYSASYVLYDFVLYCNAF